MAILRPNFVNGIESDKEIMLSKSRNSSITCICNPVHFCGDFSLILKSNDVVVATTIFATCVRCGNR